MEIEKSQKAFLPIVGAPLIEVFSIIIDSRCNVGTKPFDISGDILITDGEGATISIYSRKPDKPKRVSMGQPLPLTFSGRRAISPRGVVVVDVNLMDKTQNVVIARDRCEWDYSVKNDYEVPEIQRFFGSDGFYVDLKYITYRCAVIAQVTVKLRREKGAANSPPYANIYGSIDASIVNKHMCSKYGAREKVFPSIRLFDARADQAVRMNFGKFFRLSRYVVVVPAYSHLVLDTNLTDYDNEVKLCSRSIEFQTMKSCWSEKTNGAIEVRIDWVHPYKQRLPRKKLKHTLEALYSGEKVKSETEEKNEKPLAHYEQETATAFRGGSSMIYNLSCEVKDEESVMEIFSVVVGDWVSKLHGSILATDDYGDPVVVYQKDEQSPEELSKDNMVAPIGIGNNSRIVRGGEIEVVMRLKDDQGREVCFALEPWSDHLRGPFWFGKRQCAVARGSHGYAAMHYTVFRAGLPATVRAVFFARGSHRDATFEIHGKIVSEYGNHMCETHYEKEYYRSRLLVSPQSNPVKCKGSGSDIPLSKTQVAVPSEQKSSLIIDAELYVQAPGGDVIELLQGSEKFVVGVDQLDPKNIEGKQFYIQLFVEFGEVCVL